MSHDNSLFKLHNKLSYIVVDIKVTDTSYLFISTPYSMIFKMHKNPSQIRRMLIQILKNTPKSQDLLQVGDFVEQQTEWRACLLKGFKVSIA